MTTIRLPADCSRDAVLAIWPQLKAAGPGAATIDGSAVEKAGQALLQVLLVAGAGQKVANPSPALVEVARLAGLDVLVEEGVAA